MELNRKPTLQEIRLLEILINKSSITFSENWKEELLVRSMNDEKMGSLYLYPKDNIKENRIFGDQISELQFTDEDGVEVIASLNTDEDGNLFELDIWKTDFSQLIKFPEL